MRSENDSNCPIDFEEAKCRVMGDVDFLKEMLVEFGESVPNMMGTLRGAIDGRDGELLSKTAHQLKGAAFNLSLPQVAARAAALNEAGRQVNFEAAASAFKELEQAVLELKGYLQEKLW